MKKPLTLLALAAVFLACYAGSCLGDIDLNPPTPEKPTCDKAHYLWITYPIQISGQTWWISVGPKPRDEAHRSIIEAEKGAELCTYPGPWVPVG